MRENDKQEKCALRTPADKAWAETDEIVFRWEPQPEARGYTLMIQQLQGQDYVTIRQVTDLRQPEYRLTEPLPVNQLYRWEVEAVRADGTARSLGTHLLAGRWDYSSHPANRGLSFAFDRNGVSEPVLRNYLSRAMVCQCLDEEHIAHFAENLRMILYTGAKYINRSLANSAWLPTVESLKWHETYRELIDLAHRYDPELVFEAPIFETTTADYRLIPIPPYVFEAFGLPVEERGFDYNRMIYEDGHYAECMGPQYGHPDLSRVETQMWFYYRGTSFIDDGFEAIHLGSVPCMTDVDRTQSYRGLARVGNLLRAYARSHARRGYVFFNAHTHGMLDEEGKSIVDFNAYQLVGHSPAGAVPHPPTEENPQEIVIEANYKLAIYGKSGGGVTPSGWARAHLPYLVELDNFYPGPGLPTLDQPTGPETGMSFWGLDEIGWFRRQPTHYRRWFLGNIRREITNLDPEGYFEMPGIRFCVTPADVADFYHANLEEWCGNGKGSGDETAIRNIWIEERNRQTQEA